MADDDKNSNTSKPQKESQEKATPTSVSGDLPDGIKSVEELKARYAEAQKALEEERNKPAPAPQSRDEIPKNGGEKSVSVVMPNGTTITVFDPTPEQIAALGDWKARAEKAVEKENDKAGK